MASAACGGTELLAASTKIIGVGRNYVAHANELGNPVPKVRFARLPSSITKRSRDPNFPQSLPSSPRGLWFDLACVWGVLQEPVLFLKPTSSFLHAGVATATVEIPEPLESLHHEVELAVVISRRGRDIPEASAMDFVGGNLRIASQWVT
jgi:acylpyruvate hydrolase